MSDIEDLQNKILQFKVIELQTLLRHANSVKYGRKQELQKRAFDILKQNPDIIRNKVLEIYQAGYEKYPFPSLPTSNNGAYALQYFANAASYSSMKPVSVKSLTFAESPFFVVIGSLMDPVVLAPSNCYSNVAEVRHYSFDLSVDHANLLAQLRKTVKAHLKFCVSEMSKRKDTFPYGLSVEVNGKHCTLPNTPRDSDQKQQKYYVDISSLIKISPMVPNRIKISWIREPVVYGATIHLVAIKDTSELLTNMLQNKMIPSSVTTAMVVQKLAPDPDDEIATTNLKASLICPLSKKRMCYPCRPASCIHLQCFDTLKFLLLNEQKEYFICPICHKSITFEELQIDSVFYEILSKTSDKCNEVEFLEDGSWSTEFYKKNSKNKRKRHIEVVDIAESEDEGANASSDSSPKKKRKEGSAKKSSTKKEKVPNVAGCSSDGLEKGKTPTYGNASDLSTSQPICVNKSSFPKTKETSWCDVPQYSYFVPFKAGNSQKSPSHSFKYSHISKTESVVPSSHNEGSFVPVENLSHSSIVKRKNPALNLEQHDIFSSAQQSPIDYSISGSVKLPDKKISPPKPSLIRKTFFEKEPGYRALSDKMKNVHKAWKTLFSGSEKAVFSPVGRVSSDKLPSIDKLVCQKSPGAHSKTTGMPTNISVDEQAFLSKISAVDMDLSTKHKMIMDYKRIFGKMPAVNINISPKVNNITKRSSNVHAPNAAVPSRMPIIEKSNMPKIRAIDMTVSSKMSKMFTNNTPFPVNNPTSAKHYVKSPPADIKVPKKKHSSLYSNGGRPSHISSKVEGLVSLPNPLLQHSGLSSSLHHYPSMPAIVHPNSVNFTSPKMFLPSEPESPCLYPPFMQARCPPQVPFFPYNMPYYNQALHFGSFFGDHVQGVPNMYPFLPSTIFPQNLHEMNGDFLGQQAR